MSTRRESEFGKPRGEDPEYHNLTPNSAAAPSPLISPSIDVAKPGCVLWRLQSQKCKGNNQCMFGCREPTNRKRLLLGYLGYVHGDPRRLIHPTDSEGNFCGEGEFKNRPYLFIFDLLQCAKVGVAVAAGCPTTQVCIAECPKTYFTFVLGSTLEQKIANSIPNMKAADTINKTRTHMICRDGVDPLDDKESIASLVRSQKCAAYYVPSIPVISRCVPSVFKKVIDINVPLRADDVALKNAAGEVLTAKNLEEASKHLARFSKLRDYATIIFKDLKFTWKHILIGLAIVMGVSMLWILLLQLIVVPVFCISILAFLGICTFSGYWSFTEYKKLSERNMTADFGLPNSYVSANQQFIVLRYTLLSLGCVSIILGVLFALVSLFVLTHIRVAIELIKEASNSILRIPLVVVWPFIPFAMQLGVVAYWISSALYLASIGEKQYGTRNITNLSEALTTKDIKVILSNAPCDPVRNISGINELCEFVKYGGNELILYIQIFMLFMFFWLINFMVALNQLIVAGAFTTQFWTRNKALVSQLAICSSLWRAFRYHLGSVALGSLIIAIVRMVRVFLEYVSNRVRRAQSKIALFLIRCLICCVWCLEHILKFINKNAYIMVAMFGQNFCRSSKEAFLLIMRNLLQTGVVDKVVDFIVIISKLLITGLAGVAAYYWFNRKVFVLESEILDLEFPLLPVIVLTVGAFLVTTIFFSILDQAVDTLFICFLEDLERNDGSPEKPYFMNQNLLRVLGKKNEAPQVESTPEVPPQKAQEHRASQVLSQPQYQSQL